MYHNAWIKTYTCITWQPYFAYQQSNEHLLEGTALPPLVSPFSILGFISALHICQHVVRVNCCSTRNVKANLIFAVLLHIQKPGWFFLLLMAMQPTAYLIIADRESTKVTHAKELKILKKLSMCCNTSCVTGADLPDVTGCGTDLTGLAFLAAGCFLCCSLACM